MNSGMENLEQMLKMENSKPVILIKIIVIHISKCTQADPIIFSIFKEKSDINFQYKNLDVQINTSVLNGESKTQLQQLSSKTLEMGQIETMEYMTTLQSQPMLESEGEEVENQQDQIEKNQDSSISDIVSRHRIRYTATRIKYPPTRIKSRKFFVEYFIYWH